MMSILAVFVLVSVSFISSAEVNADVEKKDSPLYRLRARQAISEKLDTIIENIKTRFIGERLFCLPIKLFRISRVFSDVYWSCTECTEGTCQRTNQACCTTNSPCTYKTCDN